MDMKATVLHVFTFMTSLLVDHVLAAGDVIALNDNNINSILASSDIAVVNFYADWCRFSQMLAPTFEDAGTKFKEEFPHHEGKVVFAKVDSDKETNIAGKYRINKYPTIKLFRGGSIVKKEYRGQRSVEALVQFAKEQAVDSVHPVDSLDALAQLDQKKRHVVGFFESKESENYRIFSKVGSALRDECSFHAAVGPIAQPERPIGDAIKIYMQDNRIPYTGALANAETLQNWATENCTPLVREITFENAEELTEEGLPFLILFHHPDDKETVEAYTQEVAKQILHEKVNLNFLTADGLKFAHPLHHLGKSTSDLPLICIDSFRHMYLFPKDVKRDLRTPGVLKQFVEDLHSGKLHREFHHGPDPTQPPAAQIEVQTEDANKQDPTDDGDDDNEDDGDEDENNVEKAKVEEVKNIPREASEPNVKVETPQKITSPPESTFRKLAPSRNRYTILRDEL